MNYSDQIHENKAFNFFKKLMYNIVLSVCIILAVGLVCVYGFGFKPYEVLTPSEQPYLMVGDMVIVKEQKEYKPGDIIQFKAGTTATVVHRLLRVIEYNGQTYYVCHGDNVDNLDGTDYTPNSGGYQDDIEFLRPFTDEEVYNGGFNVQMPTENAVLGKVVAVAKNYGTYFNFISSHKLLFIAIVVGIWCISGAVQNELEMRRAGRLW